LCDTIVSKQGVRDQASSYGFDEIPLAKVLEGQRRRVYQAFVTGEIPEAEPRADASLEALLPNDHRWFSPPLYGLTTYADLFTPRQLVALATFSDLVGEARYRRAGVRRGSDDVFGDRGG
jgi:putative DNA methylase